MTAQENSAELDRLDTNVFSVLGILPRDEQVPVVNEQPARTGFWWRIVVVGLAAAAVSVLLTTLMIKPKQDAIANAPPPPPSSPARSMAVTAPLPSSSPRKPILRPRIEFDGARDGAGGPRMNSNPAAELRGATTTAEQVTPLSVDAEGSQSLPSETVNIDPDRSRIAVEPNEDAIAASEALKVIRQK